MARGKTARPITTKFIEENSIETIEIEETKVP